MRSNYLLISAILIVLLAGSVSAEMKVIHNAWHEYKDQFTLEGNVIDLRLSSGSDEIVRVKVDNATSYVELDRCATIDKFIICYENMSYEVDQATVSDSDRFVPGMKINISYYDLTSDLGVAQKFGTYYVYEDAQINFTLKNNKDQWLELFTFELTIPADVTVVSNGDFIPSAKGKLVYTGSLPSKAEKNLTLTIKSSSAGQKNFKQNITIVSQGLSKSSASTFAITIATPYTFTATFLQGSINVLDTSRLLITVKNVAKKDLILEGISIKGPDGVYYTPSRGLTAEGNGKFSLSQSETLLPGRDREFYIVVSPQYLGKYNFSADARMKYSGGILLDNKNASLTASSNGFMPVLSLNKDAVLTGSNVEVLFSVSNTNSDYPFKNINARITSDFYSEGINLTQINTNEEKVLLRKSMKVPYVDEDKTYKINAVVDFTTSSGEKKQVNITKNLRVTSNGTLLSLNHKLSSGEITEGEELIVELGIKNMKDEVFQITVEDTLPKGATKIGGVMKNTITLQGLAVDTAYIYKLYVPVNSGIRELNITSSVQIPANQYSKNLSTIVKVKAAPAAQVNSSQINVSNSENLEGSINPGDIVVQTGDDVDAPKKDSGFRKFFRNMSSFFEGLFS